MVVSHVIWTKQCGDTDISIFISYFEKVMDLMKSLCVAVYQKFVILNRMCWNNIRTYCMYVSKNTHKTYFLLPVGGAIALTPTLHDWTTHSWVTKHFLLHGEKHHDIQFQGHATSTPCKKTFENFSSSRLFIQAEKNWGLIPCEGKKNKTKKPSSFKFNS